jgi:iron(III) transport system permease protein
VRPAAPVRARSEGWRGASRPPLALLLAGALVAGLAVAPLLYLLVRGAEAAGGPLDLALRPRTVEVLGNTLVLGVSVGLAAAAVGLPLGWLTARTDLPGRRWWAVLVIAPLAIPSYVLAFALIAMVGPGGALRDLLAPLGVEQLPSVYGFPGAVLVLTLATYPYVTLAVRAVLRRTDAGLEEAARMLGDPPRSAVRRVVLPLLVPAVTTGALLATLYALADFGSVALLQYDSFARAIYVQYRAAFDRSLAAVLALGLAAVALGATLVEAQVRGRRPPVVARTGARPAPPVALGRWRWPAIAVCGLVVGLALVLPIVTLVGWLLRGLARDEPLRVLPDAIANTLVAGLGACLVAMLLSLPVGLLAVRWPGRVTRLIEAASVTTYALPGIVVALAVVFLALRVGSAVYQTLGLLLLALAVRFLPLAIAPLREGLRSVSPRLEESARLLGRSPLTAFREVTLPILRPGLVAGAALVFLSAIKELPVTLLVAPTGFRTLATSVWSAVGDGFYARAAAPALVLVAVSVVGVGLLLRQEGRT